MATNALRTLWAEPRPTNAPGRGSRATRTLAELRDIAEVTQSGEFDDDGSGAGGRAPAGYGLVGTRERATLLGGTFHAGPIAERGWQVEAVLPRTGTPR